MDIIDLDDPFSPPRRLPHATSWEVADVQWSPHASKPSWVISTSNQKALVWNLALPSSCAIEHMLHGHQRAITDINFHGFQPEMIATCSVDSFVHIWDLRDNRKLVQSFADWAAGATQVKWNRKNPYLLASAHNSKVHIWDSRKGSKPLHTLKGHLGKVNGLDFSREEETVIMTSSNDCTVRQWDYNQSSDEARKIIQTDFPVWRARHTPFGQACIIMPLRGGNNTIYMNDMGKNNTERTVELNPLHEFKGHSEPVKEFVWRTRGGNTEYEDREFQLVTWSKDQDLKLWPLSSSILDAAHYQRGEKLRQRITRKGSQYVSYQREPRIGKGNKKKMGSFPLYGLSPETTATKKGNKKNEIAFMTGVNHHQSVKSKHRNEHLHWISGVRIGNSAFAAPFDNTQNAGSTHLAEHYESNPANLGEEVGIVGHKFPKVRFENISVATGECVLSLNGPWGDEESLVFLRVEVKFPHNYPYAAPKFKIEDKQKYEESIVANIAEGLKNIAEKLTGRGKYCLEPCLRYLLGEKVALEDYETDHDDEILMDHSGPSAGGTTEEDLGNEEGVEDGLTELQQNFSYSSSSSSSEDEPVPSILSQKKNYSYDSTPIPKGCGAVWSKNGVLVCFFTKKKEKSVKPVSTESPASIIQSRYPTITPKNSSATHDPSQSEADETDSMSDDYDDYGNNNDNMLESFKLGERYFTGPKTRAANFRIPQHRPRSARSARSGNTGSGTGTTVKLEKEKNVIQFFNYQDLIPSKDYLAAEYRVMGDSPAALARHNAQIASKHDSKEISDCWKLLELLLTNHVPLGEIGENLPDGFYSNKIGFGLFEWGDHPLGKRWMIEELFNYFEQQSNTQMLATMSCVLSGRALQTQNTENSTLGAARLDLHAAAYPRSPFNELGTNCFSPKTPNMVMPSNSQTSNPMFVSARSATPCDIPTYSSNFKSHSPIIDQSPGSSSKDDSSIISLSPEKFMSARKAVAGIFSRNNQQQTTDKNTAINTSFNSQQSSSSVQPLKISRWQLPTTTRVNDDGFQVSSGGTTTTQHESRNSFVGSEPGDIGNNYNNGLPNIKIEMIRPIPNNDDIGISNFEPEVSPSLLDLSNESKYRRYRWQYALILFTWGFEIQSLEVLKYNFNLRPWFKSKLFKGVHSISVDLHDDEGNNNNPESKRFAKTCQYCKLIVKTRFFQCENCNHVLHSDCAIEWNNDNEIRECPSGCGCRCLEYV